MGRSATGRAEHAPLRIEPACGQVSEYVSKAGMKDAWHVLQEHVAGSYVANDSDDIGPNPAVVSLSLTLSGKAERLAGETCSEAIHDATPRSAVEGSEIIPDRRVIQLTAFHTCDQDRGVIGFPFRVADDGGAGHGKLDSEFEAADPGT